MWGFYGPLTLQVLQGFVFQGAGGQAPFDGAVTGADGQRHRRSLLLQCEVEPAEKHRRITGEAWFDSSQGKSNR